MNGTRPQGCCAVAAWLGLGGRWFVGGLLIYMGLVKGLDPVGFLKLVRQYELVQTPWLLNALAATLPWFEVFCGALLFAGVAVRGAALSLLAMLAPFTVLVLKRALEIQAAAALPFCSVKFDCGCGMGEVYICHKLAENLLLIVFAAWLVTGQGRQWAARYRLFQ